MSADMKVLVVVGVAVVLALLIAGLLLTLNFRPTVGVGSLPYLGWVKA